MFGVLWNAETALAIGGVVLFGVLAAVAGIELHLFRLWLKRRRRELELTLWADLEVDRHDLPFDNEK
jgi:hypothetical protein